MIDFNNSVLWKLKPVNNNAYAGMIGPFLVPSEEILASFQTVRDGVVFTSKRIITINIQGVTGKKRDFTSLPYSKIQAFSVETAGVLDMDSELEIWFAGLGKVKLEFTAGTNVAMICRVISMHVL